MLGLGKKGFLPRACLPGPIQAQQHQIRILGRSQGPLHPDLLHQILGFPYPRRIQKPHRHPFHRTGAFHNIPGGARLGGNDGPIFSQQGVEQGAFPRVGQAQYGHLGPFPQHPVLPSFLNEGIQLPN